MEKEILLGKTPTQIQKIVDELGLPKYTAKQIVDWIYRKRCLSIEAMSNLSKASREALAERYEVGLYAPEKEQVSTDGTKKYLFAVGEHFVEVAYIPDHDRATLCVSTQAGCQMDCFFCVTGKQGFQKNLSVAEIANQILSLPEFDTLSNIVFMGMGEPLLNSENLFESLSILLDKKTHNFSRNKITVSTCGIVEDQLYELAKFGVKLAVSLHAPNDEIRNSLMPINRKYGIEKILEATKKYHAESNTEKITFEYLLLNKVNDSAENAQQLIKLLRNFPAKVNLIVYNDWPNSIFKGTRRENASSFSMNLIKHGLRAVIRKSRGDDIFAACGQLKSAEINRK